MRVYHDFFWNPDPDQRFQMRIRPNDTDPTWSGSETLHCSLPSLFLDCQFPSSGAVQSLYNPEYSDHLTRLLQTIQP